MTDRKLDYDWQIDECTIEEMENPSGEVQTLRDFTRILQKEGGINISKLEERSGIGHPLLTSYLNGVTKNPSFKTMISVLDIMGYDLIIKEREKK